MVMRVPALTTMAEATGKSPVAFHHHDRTLKTASPPYCTAMGRGHRAVHVPSRYTVPVFLAAVIDDPMNAAVKVPALGELRLSRITATRRQVIQESDGVSYSAPKIVQTEEIPGATINALPDESFFDRLVSIVNGLAEGSTEEDIQLVRNGFEVTITHEPFFMAEMKVLYTKCEDAEWWLHYHYWPTSTEPFVDTFPAAFIQRSAVINLSHMTMLAELYADTLRHQMTESEDAALSQATPRNQTNQAAVATQSSLKPTRFTRENGPWSHSDHMSQVASIQAARVARIGRPSRKSSGDHHVRTPAHPPP